jgi:four helix bundle protein
LIDAQTDDPLEAYMTTTFKSYQDLAVWKRAMKLTKEVYQVTRSFPSDERFGLTNQIRRAAVSIPSNLAEGHARAGAPEFARFISISMGSVADLETQLMLARELEYGDPEALEKTLHDLNEIGKMLRGLAKAFKCEGGVED